MRRSFSWKASSISFICLAALFLASCAPQSDSVILDDVAHFWEAYDQVVATSDSTEQYQLLDSLFISRGTPGLEAIMERRGYTHASYLDAINQYPRFWASVRTNTLKASAYAGEIDAGIAGLRKLYPNLQPARVFFTVGALMTPGMTLEDVVFIGSETAMADRTVVTDELPDWLAQNLRRYFDTNPIEDVAFLNVHEYVHTQQGPFGSNLLAVALQEGVAEYLAVLSTGQSSPTPAVAYGEANFAHVRDRFATEMFSPNWNDWLYNNFSNEFAMRDLGYYVGYAIAQHYHEGADDPASAIATLIELDYQDPTAVGAIVDASGYFDQSVAELEAMYEANKPTIVSIEPFENGDQSVDPSISALTITFSAPMSDRFWGFDFGPLAEDALLRVHRMAGFSEDRRSVTLEIELQPGQRHQMELSNQFRTEAGVAMDPYLIDISTRGAIK